MATNTTSSTPGAPGASGSPPAAGATTTAYEVLAANLNKAIDDLVAQIPEFQEPHPSTSGFVRTHLNVPLPFIDGAVSAVTNSPTLQATNTFDVEQAREALQFIGAFGPLRDKVRSLAKNLKFTIDQKRAKVGGKAQILYGVAKLASRDPETPSVVLDHVQLMKGHLAKGKIRKPKGQTPAPAPGSGTVTTPVTPAPAPGSGTVTAPVTPTTPAPVAQPHTTLQEGGGSRQ